MALPNDIVMIDAVFVPKEYYEPIGEFVHNGDPMITMQAAILIQKLVAKDDGNDVLIASFKDIGTLSNKAREIYTRLTQNGGIGGYWTITHFENQNFGLILCFAREDGIEKHIIFASKLSYNDIIWFVIRMLLNDCIFVHKK